MAESQNETIHTHRGYKKATPLIRFANSNYRHIISESILSNIFIWGLFSTTDIRGAGAAQMIILIFSTFSKNKKGNSIDSSPMI